jgi:cold-inducible RNA-binding protein
MDSEGKRLYIGNLHYEVSERELRDAIAAYAAVEAVEIIRDKATNLPKGFAFVELAMGSDAGAVIEALDGADLRGRHLKVQLAKPLERHARNGRGDRGRGR